jgi:hypothetical protein
MNQNLRETAVAVWGRLRGEWEKVEDVDDEMWSKKCGLLTAYVTLENGIYNFVLHMGDTEELPSTFLNARNWDEAKKAADDFIREFVAIGYEVTRSDEVRISNLVCHGQVLLGVGTNGKMYKRHEDGRWEETSMKRL